MITIAREEGVDWEPTSDLCVRAYDVLDADFGLPPVKIFLEKLSPVGAGLGGGSADAAFTLRMLSEMFGLGLDDNALAQYAARLGSDCPFFVWNRPMLGRGRGEILTPVDLPQLDTHNIKVIVPPGIHVSTASAYCGITPREQSMSKTFNEDRPGQSSAENSCERQYPSFHETGTLLYDGTPAAKNSELLKALSCPIEEWRYAVVNDFEKTVFARHPQLAAIKQSLYAAGALYASLSGTGSALFALFRK
ncbi:MAG: 4-(cytidine 5'-diphospho)-2-C-methyl-D-erythritol kinase [Bacteroidales bacterium]|nr:4-(cytidine 5'-diphospho)-2-C-methyl-D-erythritol kinase [Bacteroidales bacterium]